MNNDDLKKKIVDTICEIKGHTILQAEQIADALISEGIGDVKATEHRAKVAERALYNVCNDLANSIYSIVNNLERHIGGCAEAYMEKAEKELSEERKDE